MNLKDSLKKLSDDDWIFIWLKIIVFIDLFAVALVIPLLSSYFGDVGIDTKSLGILSSTYNFCQIFGGIFIGGFLDEAGSKRNILLLSFGSSALSYLIVGFTKSVFLLFFSRVLVGTLKHTFTIVTSIINDLTIHDFEMRSLQLGRISAVSTASFIIGPSVGSMLYKYSREGPTVAAAFCFLINMIICVLFMPSKAYLLSNKQIEHKKDVRTLYSSVDTFQKQFIETIKVDGFYRVLIFRLLYIFVEWSMSSSRIVNYFEIRFNIQRSQLGYTSTFISLVGIGIQSMLVTRIVHIFGGNFEILYICLILSAFADIGETVSGTYTHYTFLTLLPNSIIGTLISTSMRNIFTNTIPAEHTGKSLAIFNTLVSVVGVIAPIYGSQVFALLPKSHYHYKGYIAFAHTLLVVAVLFVLLPKSFVDRKMDDHHNEKQVADKNKEIDTTNKSSKVHSKVD